MFNEIKLFFKKKLFLIKGLEISIISLFYFLMFSTSVFLLGVSIYKWKSFMDSVILLKIFYSVIFLFTSIILSFFIKINLEKLLQHKECYAQVIISLLKSIVWIFLFLGIVSGLDIYLIHSKFLELQKIVYTYIVGGFITKLFIQLVLAVNK